MERLYKFYRDLVFININSSKGHPLIYDVVDPAKVTPTVQVGQNSSSEDDSRMSVWQLAEDATRKKLNMQ